MYENGALYEAKADMIAVDMACLGLSYQHSSSHYLTLLILTIFCCHGDCLSLSGRSSILVVVPGAGYRGGGGGRAGSPHQFRVPLPLPASPLLPPPPRPLVSRLLIGEGLEDPQPTVDQGRHMPKLPPDLLGSGVPILKEGKI